MPDDKETDPVPKGGSFHPSLGDVLKGDFKPAATEPLVKGASTPSTEPSASSQPQPPQQESAASPSATPASASAPATAPSVPPAETPPATPASASITLNPENLYQEYARTMAENPAFAARAREFHGRDKKQSHLSEVAQLIAERETLIQQNFSLRAQAMTADQVDTSYAANEGGDFQERWARHINAAPSADPNEARAVQESLDYYEGQRGKAMNDAAQFVPQMRLSQFEAAWQTCTLCQQNGQPADHPYFDHQSNAPGEQRYSERYTDEGTRNRAQHDRFMRVLNDEAQAAKTRQASAASAPTDPPSPPAATAPTTPAQDAATVAATVPPATPPQKVQTPQAAPAPTSQPPAAPTAGTPPVAPTAPAATPQAGIGTPNTALQQGDPVLNNGSGVAASPHQWQISELKAMTPPERAKLFPNPGDWDAAINSTQVYVPGLSEEILAATGAQQ